MPGTDAGATGGGKKPPIAPLPPASATTLSLNGVVVTLTPAAEFPVDDPVFVFVSAALDGKSIELGIAGGSYADGDETITLILGKQLTLQNTADGSRYELELLTVQGFVPPEAQEVALAAQTDMSEGQSPGRVRFRRVLGTVPGTCPLSDMS